MTSKKTLRNGKPLVWIMERAKKDSYDPEFYSKGSDIKIVGVGGAGCNSISRLYKLGVIGADILAINIDKLSLKSTKANKKLLIGEDVTEGIGSVNSPTMGKNCALSSIDKIQEFLGETDILFLIAGMGGGTGTGASPIIADIAKKQGATVICFITIPFSIETERYPLSREGISTLIDKSDGVIVLDNNRLLEFVPNLSINQAFSVMDQLIAETIKGIVETITTPSLINIDVEDLISIFNSNSFCTMLWGEADLDSHFNSLISETLHHPLLNIDYSGAKGALIHITGGPNLSLKYLQKVAIGLTQEFDVNTNIVLGARILSEFQDKCRVMMILTGIPYSKNFLSYLHKTKLPDSRKKISVWDIKDQSQTYI